MRGAYLDRTLAASSPRAISSVFLMPTLPSWHAYSNIGPGVRGSDRTAVQGRVQRSGSSNVTAYPIVSVSISEKRSVR